MKTIITSVITSIITVALAMFLCHSFCGSCGKEKCSKAATAQCHKGDEKGAKSCHQKKEVCCAGKAAGKSCDATCTMGKSKHGGHHGTDMMDMLKTDRTAFEAMLSDGEKAIIASAKADFSTMDHDGLFNGSKEEMLKQTDVMFAKITPVVEAHKEALEAVVTKNNRGKKHHEMNMDVSEEQYFKIFCIHFLLM